MSGLRELDERMTRPLRPELKRPQQRSFPNLHGLYFLLRATCSAVAEGSGTRARLVLEPDMLCQWRGMNETERYFNLLEAWLLRASPEHAGEEGGLWSDGFVWAMNVFRASRDTDGRVPSRQCDSFTYSAVHRAHLALAELFGLVEPVGWKLTKADERPVESIRLSGWGSALFELIDRTAVGVIFERNETVREQVFGGYSFGALQEVFGPFFPEWKKNLILPGWEFREGVFCFKVSLADVWCRIRIPADCQLDDLAWAIITAYEFDGDHLYQFRFRGLDGCSVLVSHPVVESPIATTELAVGEVPIQVGETASFVYDFGAWWKFRIKLEKIEPPDPELDRPVVVHFHGTPPPEYGDDGW